MKYSPILPQLQRAQALDAHTLAGTREDFTHIQLTPTYRIPTELWLV